MSYISVFGLGKVGLALVSCLAKAGHLVIGVDTDPELVAAVANGTVQTKESGVKERLQAASGRIFATTDFAKAVHETELSIIIVPTPSNALGGFSLRYVLEACRSIGNAIRTKKGTHTVSVMSTVFPGSSDGWIIPELTSSSGREIGQGLGYCYNPSFIALGDIVKGIEHTEYVLIGEATQGAGDLMEVLHKSVVGAGTPVSRMLPVEAEMTKLVSNAYDTTRVAFVNGLLAMCTEVPGANVDRITEALGHHIGKRFFRGGVPFGGPCWPRDNQAFVLFLESLGLPRNVSHWVDSANADHGRYILRKILELSMPRSTIGIIGLAYKAGTNFLERSYAIDLIRCLQKEGCSVIVWDPLAMDSMREIFGDSIRFASSGEECLGRAELTVLLQPLKEFEAMDWDSAAKKWVVDCWRSLTGVQKAKIGHYIALGEGSPGTVSKPDRVLIS